MTERQHKPVRTLDETDSLGAALAREQQRSSELQRRADHLEEAARTAFRLASWGGLHVQGKDTAS